MPDQNDPPSSSAVSRSPSWAATGLVAGSRALAASSAVPGPPPGPTPASHSQYWSGRRGSVQTGQSIWAPVSLGRQLDSGVAMGQTPGPQSGRAGAPSSSVGGYRPTGRAAPTSLYGSRRQSVWSTSSSNHAGSSQPNPLVGINNGIGGSGGGGSSWMGSQPLAGQPIGARNHATADYHRPNAATITTASLPSSRPRSSGSHSHVRDNSSGWHLSHSTTSSATIPTAPAAPWSRGQWFDANLPSETGHGTGTSTRHPGSTSVGPIAHHRPPVRPDCADQDGTVDADMDEMRRSRPTRRAAPTKFRFESSPASDQSAGQTDLVSAPPSDALTEEDDEGRGDENGDHDHDNYQEPENDGTDCHDGSSNDAGPPGLPVDDTDVLFDRVCLRSVYPSACIKRQIQKDEDVGKIAQVVPLIVGKSVQLFMISLIAATVEKSQLANTRRLSIKNLLDAISDKPEFDFLREIDSVRTAIEIANSAAANTSGVKARRGTAGPNRRKKKSDPECDG